MFLKNAKVIYEDITKRVILILIKIKITRFATFFLSYRTPKHTLKWNYQSPMVIIVIPLLHEVQLLRTVATIIHLRKFARNYIRSNIKNELINKFANFSSREILAGKIFRAFCASWQGLKSGGVHFLIRQRERFGLFQRWIKNSSKHNASAVHWTREFFFQLVRKYSF